MSQYFIKDDYTENLNNLYYDDAPADDVIWQPDVYRYAVEYAKRRGIKNIVDIGSGNGDKLLDYKDEFSITFIDFGANLEIIKSKFKASKGKHSYINQDFEESFPELPTKIIKDAVVICSDVVEHIRNMDNLCKALVAYSKTARLLMVSTPERYRLYGFDQSGIPTNPCHVREWRMHELGAYFRDAGMKFQIGLTRTNDKTNQRATLCVISGKDFAEKKDADVAERLTPVSLRKFISKDEILTLLEVKGVKAPNFESNFVGLLNPYQNNYMLNHFLAAVISGKTYSVNKFKFLNQDAFYRSIGANIENIDRTLLQFLSSGIGEYPVAFTFLYDGDAKTNKQYDLLTLSAEHLYVHYLPEVLLGFNLLDINSETLARLPNYANTHNEAESHDGVRRSAKLLAGNIKRKVVQRGNNS